MSEKDRYELKIAGLLHDCGKITTPVHVVDKATKLQTIFDRIAPGRHALRGAQARGRGRNAAREAEGDRGARRAKRAPGRGGLLGEARASMTTTANSCARTNIGSERMEPEDQARVSRIARYEWRDERGETSRVPVARRGGKPQHPPTARSTRRSARSSTTTSWRRSRCSRRCPGRATS